MDIINLPLDFAEPGFHADGHSVFKVHGISIQNTFAFEQKLVVPANLKITLTPTPKCVPEKFRSHSCIANKNNRQLQSSL